MKKVIFAITALLFVLVAFQGNAQTKGAKSDKARKNLEALAMVNKAIMSGDVSILDKIIAEDAVDHAGMHGELIGRDAIKAELISYHTMAPDIKLEVLKELADDEYVFQWMRYTGTTANADMGMPAGTKFDMNAIEVSKFKDGKAVEHWQFMQMADMMKMMPQNPGAGNATDSMQNK